MHQNNHYLMKLSMENKLQRLADQFRDLPNQTLLRQRKVQLSTIANRIESSLEQVREANRRVISLRDVLENPTLLAEAVDTQLAIIRRSAQKLSPMVSSVKVPESAKVSAPLQNVTDAATSLRNAVASEWAAASSGEVDTAEAFVALAGTFDAQAQRELQAALSRFRRSVASPPSDAAAMSEYRASRRALLTARDALQISGPVADFLLSAAKGAGSAHDLRSEQVLTFLDIHPVLWSRLRVSLS